MTNHDNLGDNGLSSEEAKRRLVEHGPNQIFRPAKISFFGIFRHEVTEPMILLLLFVGLVYSIWGELPDAITIFVVISLLVLAEVYNEFRAKKAIASLSKIAAPKVRVLRDGTVLEIDSENVVPGDVLVLVAGTKVAADARIVKSLGLQVDESALTGESFPQDKNNGDEVFAGTIVVSGEGSAQVFSTGKSTRLGAIAESAQTVTAPKTPLQLAMKSLAGKLVYVALFFSVSIPLLGVLRGQNIKTMVLTGLSLSFATIPEELPMVITMVLGLGAYTLSKNKFLVKRIKAAETLGNATVIVTDKTGTITESRMKIVSLYPKNREKDVIEKAFLSQSIYSLSPLDLEVRDKAGELKIGTVLSEPSRKRDFGDGRKTRVVIRGHELFASGAPEEIFTFCRRIPDDAREELRDQTSRGRRVIGVAYRKLAPNEKSLDFKKLEHGMDLIGLIGFEDPPRQGVRETIEKAASAGVRTIMVTGDHPMTASFIAKQVGILAENGKALNGADIDKLSDEKLQNAVRTVSVFARATPEHKYRIVKALQKNGDVVAVTGDGINDVLALKGADIGIAMGLKGTDVAKDAAEVVLADDNYITITQGIFEGRKFFDNLQKGIKYYLSIKTALILIFLLPVVIGIAMPFSPIQIIVLELFMDLAASAGFVSEPKEKDIYYRMPRDPKQGIFNAGTVRDIFTRGAILFVAVMSVYLWARYENLSLPATQTFAFSAWIFGHIVLAFISRSDKEPVLSIGIFRNKVINAWSVSAIVFLLIAIYTPLNVRFNLAAISPIQLALIAIVTVFIVGTLEAKKLFAAGRQMV